MSLSSSYTVSTTHELATASGSSWRVFENAVNARNNFNNSIESLRAKHRENIKEAQNLKSERLALGDSEQDAQQKQLWEVQRLTNDQLPDLLDKSRLAYMELKDAKAATEQLESEFTCEGQSVKDLILEMNRAMMMGSMMQNGMKWFIGIANNDGKPI